MRHFILYYHGGSANHGCEALVRTTAELLDYKRNRISLASFRPDEDLKYGIDKFCDIHNMFESKSVNRWYPKWIKAYLDFRIKHNNNAIDDLYHLNALNAKKDDIAISIGGDNYCYNDTENIIKSNEIWRRNGIKTVLWGCSIEPELLDDSAIAEDISRFDLITARESITYEAVKRVNPNTILVSDSAFRLKTVNAHLPDKFLNSDIIGLNLSPLAEQYELYKGVTRKNIERLIEYILNNTTMKIMLIPHVVGRKNDDRIIHTYFFEKYKNSNKISMIDDCTCEELKGYISKCRFFVGARTHATIAAYSSMIPTIVLGYSVKSRGIARDLFGTENHFVIPVQQLKDYGEMSKAFEWIMNHEDDIKMRLSSYIPSYQMQVNQAIEMLHNM